MNTNTPLIMEFTDEKFIGRGEVLVKTILSNPILHNTSIRQQVNISELIRLEDYQMLDEIYKKHNFDLVIYGINMIVIEVNYKHGNIPCIKWNKIFRLLLEKNNIIPVTINDYDCRSIFKLNSKKQHKLTWDDFRDIIDALEMAKINPRNN